MSDTREEEVVPNSLTPSYDQALDEQAECQPDPSDDNYYDLGY